MVESALMGKQVRFNLEVKVWREAKEKKSSWKLLSNGACQTRQKYVSAMIFRGLPFLTTLTLCLRSCPVYLGPPKGRSAWAHKLLYKNCRTTIGLLKPFGSPTHSPSILLISYFARKPRNPLEGRGFAIMVSKAILIRYADLSCALSREHSPGWLWTNSPFTSDAGGERSLYTPHLIIHRTFTWWSKILRNKVALAREGYLLATNVGSSSDKQVYKHVNQKPAFQSLEEWVEWYSKWKWEVKIWWRCLRGY